MIVSPAAAGFLVRLSSLRDGHGKFLSPTFCHRGRSRKSSRQPSIGKSETKHSTVFNAVVQGAATFAYRGPYFGPTVLQSAFCLLPSKSDPGEIQRVKITGVLSVVRTGLTRDNRCFELVSKHANRRSSNSPNAESPGIAIPGLSGSINIYRRGAGRSSLICRMIASKRRSICSSRATTFGIPPPSRF